MSRNDLWKWLVLAIVTVFSVYVVIPPKEKIRLGLDLSGGTSFTVAIDEAKLRNNIKSEDVNLTDVEVQSQINNILKDADARAIEVMRNRIDSLGVNEPVIQGGKNHRITVQLPGISADQRDAAEKSIQSAAFLEFKLVHKQNDQLVDKVFSSGRLPEGYVTSDDGRSFKRVPNYTDLVKDPSYANRLSLFEVPDPRYAFMMERVQNPNGQLSYRPVFVLRKAEMTGEALSSASVEIESMTGRVHVSLVFNAKGSAEFAKLTKAYSPRGSRNKDSEVGRQLAIVLDDTLYSAPVLRTEIPERPRHHRRQFLLVRGGCAAQHPERRLAARADEDPREAFGRVHARRGCHQQRRQGCGNRHAARGVLHVDLLLVLRVGRQHCAVPELGSDAGGPDHDLRRDGHFREGRCCFQGNAGSARTDHARHRRPRADARHGGGRERADFRTYARGVRLGQVGACCCGRRL
jgi:hypothetical protein